MNNAEEMVYQTLLDKHKAHLITLGKAAKEMGMARQTGLPAVL